MTPSSSIIIVGGGAFGTSTAYHLARRGYTNVKVLDRFEPPSKEAAATDLNKVIRCDYPNPLYGKLGQEAMTIWREEGSLFSGLFRPTGWIMAAQEMTKAFLQAAYDTSHRLGTGEVKFIDIEETKRRFPAFTGSLPGWTNLWSSEAGWVCRLRLVVQDSMLTSQVPSGEALLRMASAAKAQGVEYITGRRGWAQRLLYNDSGSCIGVMSQSGEAHLADIVVLCTGANTAALIEAKDEIIARSHCVGIMQLSVEEAVKYQHLPIVDNFEQGECVRIAVRITADHMAQAFSFLQTRTAS